MVPETPGPFGTDVNGFVHNGYDRPIAVPGYCSTSHLERNISGRSTFLPPSRRRRG